MNYGTGFLTPFAGARQGRPRERNGMNSGAGVLGQTLRLATEEPASLRGARSRDRGRWREPPSQKSRGIGQPRIQRALGGASALPALGRGTPTKSADPAD